MASQFPDRFSFTPVISTPMACTAVAASGADSRSSFEQGRVSRAVPSLLGEVSETTHFHLVGNGQFVVDFQQGLLAAGIDKGRVTTEKYFNGKAEADADVVQFLADAILRLDDSGIAM